MLVCFFLFVSFFSFEIFTVKSKMKFIKFSWASTVGVPADVDFVALFLGFQAKSKSFLSSITLLASSAYHNDDENEKSKEKLWTCSALFGTFLCHHHGTTNIVKLGWNDNAIIALICRIVATSISSEIPMHTEAHYSFCWLSMRPKIFKTV